MTTPPGPFRCALALIVAVSGLRCGGNESAPGEVPAFMGSSPAPAGAPGPAPVAPAQGQPAAGEMQNVGALSPAGSAPPGGGAAGAPGTSGGSAGAGSAGEALNGAAGASSAGMPGAAGAPMMMGAMGAGGEAATPPAAGSVFPSGVV